MSNKFVEKNTVCEDLVKTLSKKDATAVVLYDLIGRTSNCDYTKQLVDNLKVDEKLYDYLETWNVPGTPSSTWLPDSWRLYLNTDVMAKNTTQNTVGTDTPRVLPFAFKRDLVTSKSTLKTRTDSNKNDTTITDNTISIGLDSVLISFDFSFTVYDGTHTPGSTHPVPTWTTPQISLDNKTMNGLQIDINLVQSTKSNDGASTTTTNHLVSRTIMQPQDIIDQKVMRAAGSLYVGDRPTIFGDDYQFVVTVTFVGSTFNYAGVAPKIGFFKQAVASTTSDTIEPDSTNFIDVISLNLAGR